MRAFLEKTNKEWLDDFVYISKNPLLNLGVEVIAFDSDNMESLTRHYPNINTDIIIGSVETSQIFFDECGIETPNYIGYPESLKKYLHRDIKITKYNEINDEYPYFVKPKNGVKLFTGSLIENDREYRILKNFWKVNDDTELYLSEPIDIISEYRCFVHKGELKGIQYYAGDFRQFPSINVIEEMIKNYENPYISYTLDVGLIEKHGHGLFTTLIEVNDMWAIGSYGFDAKTYVRMTIDRFIEIKNNAIKI